MAAFLDDTALVHDNDTVGALDGGQAMGDDQRRATLHQMLKGRLHGCLAFRIERAGRLVEEKNGRVLQNCTGNGDALALAA